MAMKLFLSYSHQDEELKNQFETHLSQFKRDKLIESWNDRKITPGENWCKEISIHLEDADIIIFLISSDFIASDYCCEIEVKKGIQQHNEGKSILVPIVVRPCNWKDMEIGKFQALPTDLKPIVTWNNKDEGWLNVIFGLKKLINEFKEEKKGKIMLSEKKILTPAFNKWLSDTEIVFKHRRKEEIKLNDIFVYPDLKRVHDEQKFQATIIPSNILVQNTGLYLILGEDQSGKTSLCKRYYNDLMVSNYSPVFVNGCDVNKSNLKEQLKKPLKKQYNETSVDNFLSQKRKAILIDDYDNIRLNTKYQKKFINEIKEVFDIVIFIAGDSFQYVIPDMDHLDNFILYEILLLSHGKRSELIEKWITIGIEEVISEEDLYKKLDITKIHIDSFVKKNIVPPKPLFILSILQAIEAVDPNKIELTSYGHCYQHLIYKSLESVDIEHSEIDKYINYLTELAFYFYVSGNDFVEIDKLIVFSANYSAKYLALDHKKAIGNLVNCGILQLNNQKYLFKYKYIYYFYVAKYIAENVSSNDNVKGIFTDLLENLHIEKKANIIIFVTHHTKDPYILDEIMLCMMALFDDKIESTLKVEELAFMQDFIDNIPQLVIEQRDIRKEREKNNKALDDYEIVNNEIEKDIEKLEPNSILAMVNRAFKSIEIIGQIIRNRHGSLQKTTLVDLADNAYGVGLRFLKFYLNLTEVVKNDVVKIIKHLMIDDPNIKNDIIEKEAKNAFLFLVYGVIYGVLRKISFSVGSKEAEEVYDILNNNKNSPAVLLISTSIKLFFTKRISMKKLTKTYKKLEGNITCQHMFKHILIQHMYMNYVPYKKKQQISAEFGIPVVSQVVIENRNETKLLSK